MADMNFPEPKRVLQIYDAEKQKQFAHFTAKDRLEWLESITELYWSVTLQNVRPSPDSK